MNNNHKGNNENIFSITGIGIDSSSMIDKLKLKLNNNNNNNNKIKYLNITETNFDNFKQNKNIILNSDINYVLFDFRNDLDVILIKQIVYNSLNKLNNSQSNNIKFIGVIKIPVINNNKIKKIITQRLEYIKEYFDNILIIDDAKKINYQDLLNETLERLILKLPKLQSNKSNYYSYLKLGKFMSISESGLMNKNKIPEMIEKAVRNKSSFGSIIHTKGVLINLISKTKIESNIIQEISNNLRRYIGCDFEIRGTQSKDSILKENNDLKIEFIFIEDRIKLNIDGFTLKFNQKDNDNNLYYKEIVKNLTTKSNDNINMEDEIKKFEEWKINKWCIDKNISINELSNEELKNRFYDKGIDSINYILDEFEMWKSKSKSKEKDKNNINNKR